MQSRNVIQYIRQQMKQKGLKYTFREKFVSVDVDLTLTTLFETSFHAPNFLYPVEGNVPNQNFFDLTNEGQYIEIISDYAYRRIYGTQRLYRQTLYSEFTGNITVRAYYNPSAWNPSNFPTKLVLPFYEAVPYDLR